MDGIEGVYGVISPRGESQEEAQPTVVGSPEYSEEKRTLPRWIDDGFLAGPSIGRQSVFWIGRTKMYLGKPHNHFPPSPPRHPTDR